MDLKVSAELPSKLARLVSERGTNPHELARQAIERLPRMMFEASGYVPRAGCVWQTTELLHRLPFAVPS
jgi:hypothetical protein